MTQTIEQLTARVRELEGVYVPSPVSQQAPEPAALMESALEGWLGAGRTPANPDETAHGRSFKK